MRRTSKLLTAVAAGAVLALMAPTSAQAIGPYGAGEVSGVVKLSPGILLDSDSTLAPGKCEKQTYTFSSVILNGFMSDGTSTFVGSIGTGNVKGESTRPGGDCADVGKGTVNTSTDRGTFSSGAGAPNAVSGNFFGGYERHGSHVIVTLKGDVNFAGGGTYSGVPINLDASEFIPTKIDAGTGRIVEANFTGEWHVGVGA